MRVLASGAGVLLEAEPVGHDQHKRHGDRKEACLVIFTTGYGVRVGPLGAPG